MAVAFAAALWATPAGAQPATTEPAAQGPADTAVAPAQRGPAAQVVSEASPEAEPVEIWYLPDASGALRPVVGFTWEDFRQAQEVIRGERAQRQPPEWSAEQVAITGRVRGELAELEVEIRLLQTRADWVGVPLGLTGLALSGPIDHQGPSDSRCVVAEGTRGRTAWLYADKAGVEHHLKLRGRMPLEPFPGGGRLRLPLVRSSVTAAELILPQAEAVPQAPAAGLLVPVEATEPATTRVRVEGFGSELDLAWAGRPQSTLAASGIECRAATWYRLEPQRALLESVLRVSGLPEGQRTFQLRLPRGAQWLADELPGFRLTRVPPQSESDPSLGELLEVEPAAGSRGRLELKLRARWPASAEASETTQHYDLGPVEVVGAQRQTGQVAVTIDPGWRGELLPDALLQPLDAALLAAPLQGQQVDASYEYQALPFQLHVELAEQSSFVVAEPKYRLEIADDQLRLTAAIDYRVRGGRLRQVAFDLPGWQLVELGPAGQFPGELPTPREGRWTIPLAQPSVGELRLEWVAVREFPQAGQPVDLELPRLDAQTVAPAVLTVECPPSLEILPRGAELAGLTLSDDLTGASDDRHPARLAYDAATGQGRFIADYVRLPQRVEVDLESEILLDDRSARVRQRLQYRIEHEPITELVLQMPSRWASDAVIQIADEEPVAADVAATTVAEGRRLLSIPLRTARIGSLEVAVAYEVTHEPLAVDSSVLSELPLALPAQGQLGRHNLRIQAPTRLTVDLPQQPAWQTVTEPSQGETSLAWQLQATEPAFSIRLLLGLADPRWIAPTVVEQQWNQVWLSEAGREDRIVFRFTSSRPRALLRLPPGVVADDLKATFDGAPLAAPVGADGQVRLNWTPDPVPRPHVLELRYRFDQTRPLGGWQHLATAEFVDDVWSRQTYWQLVLPENSHLLSDPPGANGEFTWAWQRFHWGRKPTWEQPDLERWCGATRQPVPPRHSNRYLLSTVGRTPALDVFLADRATLVLLMSGTSLAAGLAVLYWPVLRRPPLLLAAGVAVIAAGCWHPETALVVSQSAALGCGLAALAGWLYYRRRTSSVSFESLSTASFQQPGSVARPLGAGSSSARRIEATSLLSGGPPPDPPV